MIRQILPWAQGCGNGAKAAPPSGGYQPKTSVPALGFCHQMGHVPPFRVQGGFAWLVFSACCLLAPRTFLILLEWAAPLPDMVHMPCAPRER
eukprot:358561-Chlamydomonas_euryale.AAC.1